MLSLTSPIVKYSIRNNSIIILLHYNTVLKYLGNLSFPFELLQIIQSTYDCLNLIMITFILNTKPLIARPLYYLHICSYLNYCINSCSFLNYCNHIFYILFLYFTYDLTAFLIVLSSN